MSTVAKAHGMDGTLIAPDWPPLTLQEVRNVLAEYPQLGEPTKLLSVSPRPFSAASVVATENEPVFVKRHARVVRTAERLQEEHRFLQHLQSNGGTVPAVLTSATGATAIEREEGTYEVHSMPAGIDLYEESISWTPFFSAKHARSAGEALARLHLAAQGYNAPPRTLCPLVAGFSIYAGADPATALDHYIAARPALQQYMHGHSWREDTLHALHPFHAELLPLLPALEPLWTHNDLHPSNLFWSDRSSEARVTAVIDFGLCDRTNAVHDLAQAIERSIVEWLTLVDDPEHPERVVIHFDHLRQLLDGYDSVRPLSSQEAAALAPMTALCHVEFALSETDYFLAALHAPEKARYACPDYLVGHARWFRGAGSKLLDAIRSWAAQRQLQPGVIVQ